MGKGDKRTRRGKIFAGSYGKTRPKKKKGFVPPVEEKGKKANKQKVGREMEFNASAVVLADQDRCN